jgi:hypothetical protein
LIKKVKIESIKNRMISKMMLKKEKKVKLNILIIKKMMIIKNQIKVIVIEMPLIIII